MVDMKREEGRDQDPDQTTSHHEPPAELRRDADDRGRQKVVDEDDVDWSTYSG